MRKANFNYRHALGIVLLMGASGCESQPVAVTHPNQVNLTGKLEPSNFIEPYDAELGTVRISLAKVNCAVAISGRKSEFEECVRGNFSELLTNCKNFEVENRSVSEESSGEWNAIAQGAANRIEIPKTPGLSIPQYLIKVSVSQVERNITGTAGSADWTLYVDVHADNQKRQGAVELNVEVVDLGTQTNVAAFRTRGLLSDETRNTSGSIGGIGGGGSTFYSVPENQAIREACEAATLKLFEAIQTRSRHTPTSAGIPITGK